MAGGKETPRQKLIGLMYLVLTALLALNVSKQILDAFVAIEENIQRGSEASQERGQQVLTQFNGDLEAAKGTNDQSTVKRINQCLEWIKDIDEDVDSFIQLTDSLKKQMIVAVEGEPKLKAPNEEKGGPILLKKSTYKGGDFLKPHKFNLNAIERQDDFDQPMAVLGLHEIGDVKKNSEGMNLWNGYLKVRESLVTKAGTYTDFKGKKWKLKISKHINSFKDSKELASNIEKLFKSNGNKVNEMDRGRLVEVYQQLTKNEFAKYHEEKKPIHWVGRTFDHSPLVGALASISSLQNEVLAARLKIVNLIKDRVGGGEFTFNSIKELVSGPGVATAGEEIELWVTMAAYNSDKVPQVTSSSGELRYEDGFGKITMRAAQSDMTINGTVTIKNSQGQAFTKPWSKDILIVKPQGSISLPEMAVLYRGYDNKVVPVVAGAVSSSISASNASISNLTTFSVLGNQYKGYIVKPGPGPFTTLVVKGKDSKGNQRTFATVKYKVRNFPKAQLQGTKISKSTGFNAIVSFGPDSPFSGMTFTPKSVTIDDKTYPGSRVPGRAVASIKNGKKVPVEVSYTSRDGKLQVASGILKVGP